jgi:hypothetical protein
MAPKGARLRPTTPPRKGNSAIYAEYDREMALPKAGLLKPPALIRLAERQKVQRQASIGRVPSLRIAEPIAAGAAFMVNAVWLKLPRSWVCRAAAVPWSSGAPLTLSSEVKRKIGLHQSGVALGVHDGVRHDPFCPIISNGGPADLSPRGRGRTALLRDSRCHRLRASPAGGFDSCAGQGRSVGTNRRRWASGAMAAKPDQRQRWNRHDAATIVRNRRCLGCHPFAVCGRNNEQFTFENGTLERGELGK